MALRTTQMPARMDCESSKQFGGREHDEIRGREAKSPRERSLDKIQTLHGARHDFAKPLNLPLGLKVNDDSRVVPAPFVQVVDKLRAFCFGKNKIASRELADVAILKRAGEIFRTSFNPAFADLNIRVR